MRPPSVWGGDNITWINPPSDGLLPDLDDIRNHDRIVPWPLPGFGNTLKQLVEEA